MKYNPLKKLETLGKERLSKMLNQALKLEHAAWIQYLAHAELVKGLNAEKIIERLKEIASDEAKHENKFRNLIGNYLDGEPSMGIAEMHKAKESANILEEKLKDEKARINLYKKIHKKIVENKDALPYLMSLKLWNMMSAKLFLTSKSIQRNYPFCWDSEACFCS